MLPIEEARSRITAALRQSNRLVLAAPTGSGKTTQTPRFIHEDLSPPGRIIILQPRRIAARLMAQRVAREMNSPLGELVGYQTRHDSKISDKNVIRFMTEGLLLRLMQHHPRLPEVGVVMLDEFHERSLAGDAALAMLRQLQESHRPDLRLVVMSATLDVKMISQYLDCPVVESAGRLYPVDIGYISKPAMVRSSQPTSQPIWELAAAALDALLAREPEGDVLLFMPGVYEIRRTIEACQRRCGSQHGQLAFLPLYSELPAAQQDQAISPAPRGVRKVIVSTNVAETSLTIEGVRHVIDSGLARVNRYDARRGVNTLWVEPISQASAMQRAGRAGRTAPGTCIRLWTEFENKGRAANTAAEIHRLDLSQALLWLKSLGVSDVTTFGWLEPPAAPAVTQALELLTSLGALDDQGQLTDLGRAMAHLPVHPRWARMLVEASRRQCLDRAITWAALASERDLFSRDAKRNAAGKQTTPLQSDLELAESAFLAARESRFDAGRCASLGVNAIAARQVDATRNQLISACQSAGLEPGRGHAATETIIQCLLVAFIDHLAMRRPGGKLCAMIGSQRKACELGDTAIDPQSLLLALDIRETGAGSGVKTVLTLISQIDPAWLETLYPQRLVHEKVVTWNRVKQVVEEVEQHRFDDLVFAQKARPNPDPDQATTLLAQLVSAGELKLNQWDDAVTQWIARTRSVAKWFPERDLITYDADDLAVIHQEICEGATRYTQIADRPCLAIVQSALGWDDQQFVQRMAPAKLALAGGYDMGLTYADDGSQPVGRAKIQQLYDMTQTPAVAGGRVKIQLEILGPNYRPVQITQDLEGFWKTLYPELKKELKRRYPRHEWR